MAEAAEQLFAITSPGILAYGESLPSKTSIDVLLRREAVIQLCSGAFHSVAVCTSGKAYAFGLDLDSNTTLEPTLVSALELIKITEAVCGYDFTFFISNKGQVFSTGKNENGQLGLGNTCKTWVVNLVPDVPPVKKVAAGSGHAALLSIDGEVWVCGRNDFGQLGLGHTEDVNTFTVVTALSEAIIDISCGDYVTVLLTSQHLLVAGRNNACQLGLPEIECSSVYQMMCPPVPFTAVASGNNHSIALAVDGTVWAWGDHSFGQLGIGNDQKQSLPQQVCGLDGHEILSIFAGCNNTGLATKNGDVLVCGRAHSGQLGPTRQDVTVPTLLQKSPDLVFHQVTFADTYSLMLVTRKTRVLSAESEMDVRGEMMGCVTDYERCLMACLECPVCLKVMCAPIHLCGTGHSICCVCYALADANTCPVCESEFTNGRNVVLEKLYAELLLPCMDCLVRMPVEQFDEHSRICPERRYPCPMQQSCTWGGRADAILAHAISTHNDDTWQDLPHLFSHAMSQSYVHVNFLSAHGEAFILYRNYNETSKEAHFVVRLVGYPENAIKYRFQLDFNFDSDDCNITVRKRVCSDIQTFEEVMKNYSSISLRKEMVEIYLQNDNLACRVSVLKVP